MRWATTRSASSLRRVSFLAIVRILSRGDMTGDHLLIVGERGPLVRFSACPGSAVAVRARDDALAAIRGVRVDRRRRSQQRAAEN